ncbi:MAG TPA: hypothetical protein VJT49_34055 [Amycolatopsis sp.]|uniref:hypothetical protein n=1 Tax=Amycolatopsis sp. TaxID=37632 RepID=UPI002B4A48E5|nr:hypothetical protein [Amycolatopsis sp.]HKS50047.1 hypothetical protein [Amycolatopsis sp.]
MKIRTALAVAVLCATTATTACRTPTSGAPAGGVPAGGTQTSVAGPGTCHMRTEGGQPLPDPACTPGATNPQVTQATLKQTACQSGWTKTVRPPTSYTDKLKREQISAYGYGDTKAGDYEEDHLVSLELGGSPDDPRNLWPEPGTSPNAKDKVENDLHAAVCSGRVTLAAAQQAIASDWTTAEQRLGIGS